jgi:hypothetical protein
MLYINKERRAAKKEGKQAENHLAKAAKAKPWK